jgi:uncharacterized protein (TIGR02246 family)
MKTLPYMLCVTIALMIAPGVVAQTRPESQSDPRQAVRSFYEAFNSHSFRGSESYTTEDWNHINPLGGRTRGRNAVLKELNKVHSTFLKGVSDEVEDMDVRFATPDVAVVTVTSLMTTYTTPDGVRHEHEHHVKTYVVVKRNGRWLIMQDQNTVVTP